MKSQTTHEIIHEGENLKFIMNEMRINQLSIEAGSNKKYLQQTVSNYWKKEVRPHDFKTFFCNSYNLPIHAIATNKWVNKLKKEKAKLFPVLQPNISKP